MINKENLQQSLFCFTLAVLIIIISIYLLSLYTHYICAKCQGRTLKVSYADSESFVKGGPNLITLFLVVEGTVPEYCFSGAKKQNTKSIYNKNETK